VHSAYGLVGGERRMVARVGLGQRVELHRPDRLGILEPALQPFLLELAAAIPKLRPLFGQLVVDGLLLGRSFGVVAGVALLSLEGRLAGGRIGLRGRGDRDHEGHRQHGGGD